MRIARRIVLALLVLAAAFAVPAYYDRATHDSTEPASAEPSPLPLDEVELGIEPFAEVPRPTAMATRAGDDALYVATKRGKVFRVKGADGGSRDPEQILDIGPEISAGFEQGLLGIAFSPDSKLMVINFTNSEDASVTRAYSYDGVAVDESSANDLLVVPKETEIHNAGQLAFGPDGYLYVSLGDGGLSGDPDGNAQSLKTLFGKVHRIEVLPNRTYQVPPDNPFVDVEGARGEIWAYGLRNPWRFSFDKLTGDLWVTDVGRDQREEVNFQPAGQGGLNYGWNLTEGRVSYEGRKPPGNWTPPVYNYPHVEGVCAMTGGYVYRGREIPGLYGAYVFADFCRGGIETIRRTGNETTEHRHYPVDVARVGSFGQDSDGELYMLALEANQIYRIVAG